MKKCVCCFSRAKKGNLCVPCSKLHLLVEKNNPFFNFFQFIFPFQRQRNESIPLSDDELFSYFLKKLIQFKVFFFKSTKIASKINFPTLYIEWG
jgi:hypothetical protein